jgi:thymidylate synthase (FAD)
MSAESFIAYCARVSNPANQNNKDTDGLLKYMVRNQHWSPFEMVNVVMEINTTRDIARQILRHRSFSFQEFSQRYAAVDPNNFEIRETRMQDNKNRQNSVEIDHYDDKQYNMHLEWEETQQEVLNVALDAYQWALSKGIAKEVARAVLPEGMTNSRMYMNGTLRSWIHYCQLRRGNGTQKEHRIIAEEAWEILSNKFPFLKVLDNDNN